MKYILGFAMALVLGLTSCDSLTTTLDTEGNEFFDQQMVVGSIIDAETPFVNFFVGENRGFLETGTFDEFNIAGASISIEKESTGETILSVEDEPSSRIENYSFPGFPSEFFEAGEYTFSVEHPSYPTSVTTLYLPEKRQLDNIEFEFEAGIDIEGNETSSLTFDIIDEPGVDFYELAVFIDGRQIDVETFDPAGSKGLNFRNLLFRDDSFEGQRRRVEIRFRQFFWNPVESEEIRLRWFSVNEGYFLLSKSVQRQNETSDNPFASAVQINGNVNEALGVIGLTNQNEFIINP